MCSVTEASKGKLGGGGMGVGEKATPYLVLSESIVWNNFSSSSSFRLPSEKKAWNSSKESFPSSVWTADAVASVSP